MTASLYLTTSRKPGRLTRRVARTLAHLLGAVYENRGKRSVAEVSAQAAQLGLKRCAFVYEAHGNPARLSFWEDSWLEPELRIRSVRGGEGKPARRLPGEARVLAEDEAGEKLRELLNLPEPEGHRFVEVHASREGLRFLLEGQELLALEGSLGKGGSVE